MESKIQPIEEIKSRLLVVRGRLALLDRDVAAIYGVTTKAINQAVKRNEAKFPIDYRFALQENEVKQLVTNCDRFKTLKHSTSAPYAFTEKGLYMLATILRSPMAVEATFDIIETFAAVKDLQRTLIELHNERDAGMQPSLMTRFSELLSDLVLPGLRPDESETSIELNFFIGKLKHTVRRKRRADGPDIVEEPQTPYGEE